MPKQLPNKSDWVQADFNGMLEHNLLCLAHEDTVKTEDGRSVTLKAGLQLTAYDSDLTKTTSLMMSLRLEL